MLCHIMQHAVYNINGQRKAISGFDMSTRDQNLRQSMWSVRPALLGVYFGLFTLTVLFGTAWIVMNEIVVETSDSAFDTWIVIMQGVGTVGLASAVGAFTLTEIMEYAMVMANWFRQQYLEPLKERQREEGREEALARVRSEMLKRGIKLTKEDEDALFNHSNGHSR